MDWSWLDGIAGAGAWSRGVVVVVALTGAALVVGSAGRLLTLWARPGSGARQATRSLGAWWVIYVLMGLGLMLGRVAIVVLFAVVAARALFEFFRLAAMPQITRRIRVVAIAAVVAGLGWIAVDRPGVFLMWTPIVLALGLPSLQLAAEKPEGFLRATGTLLWGVLLCGYLLLHAPLLLTLPGATDGADSLGSGGGGWFVWLVLLTIINDIAQSQWGKRLQGPKITPVLSPGKTWAGLIGGVVTTAVVAVVVAPLLTPWKAYSTAGVDGAAIGIAAAVGAVLGVAGFMGDITMSAIKRDVGVKDTGHIVPGQGGILDRVDSLIYTAPLLYHSVAMGIVPGAIVGVTSS